MTDTLSWILPGELAVGPYVTVGNIPLLRRAGITAILNLQQPDERPQVPPEVREAFLWQRIPTLDGIYGGVPDVEWFAEVVNCLCAWRKEGETFYIHCYAGQGRSPLACMAYLAVGRNMRLTEAIWQVKQAHPPTNPNVHQLLALCQYVRDALSRP
jgi:protein-tyrosine phosphatase